MKSIIQSLSILSSIGLLVLGVLVLLAPTSVVVIKCMIITGFIAAVSTLVSIEWWRRDEEEYKKLFNRKEQNRKEQNRKEQRIRLRTHI